MPGALLTEPHGWGLCSTSCAWDSFAAPQSLLGTREPRGFLVSPWQMRSENVLVVQ